MSIFSRLNPVTFYKKAFEAGRDRESEQFIKDYRASRLRSLRDMRRGRDYVEAMSYTSMLESWGIEEEQVELVIRGMKIEILSLALVLIMALWVDYQFNSLFFHLSTLCVFSVFIMAVLSRSWRITCLRQKAFTPFKKWIKDW